MAIYRCEVKPVSRGAGKSVAAAAAYRTASRVRDIRTGLVFDYRQRSGVEISGIFMPKGTPDSFKNREFLWGQAEAAEKRKDARTARELILSLPHELDAKGRQQLLAGFLNREVVGRGLIADAAIHEPDKDGDHRNFHAHILVTTRPIDLTTGQLSAKKDRDFAENGGQIELLRQTWGRYVNQALERAGHDARVDHRSLAAQRADAEREADLAATPERKAEAEARAIELSRTPEQKLGPAVTAMTRKKEVKADNLDAAKAVETARQERARMATQAAEWLRLVRDHMRAIAERAEELIRDKAEAGAKAVKSFLGMVAKGKAAEDDRQRLAAVQRQREALERERLNKIAERVRDRAPPTHTPRGRGRSYDGPSR